MAGGEGECVATGVVSNPSIGPRGLDYMEHWGGRGGGPKRGHPEATRLGGRGRQAHPKLLIHLLHHMRQLDRTLRNLFNRPPLTPRNPVLQIQHIPNLITSPQHRINVILRMRRTDTEPHSARHKRRSRVRHNDNDNRCLSILHHRVEHVHLSRVEEQEGNDGRCGMAIGDEPELDQPVVQISRVESKPAQACRTF